MGVPVLALLQEAGAAAAPVTFTVGEVAVIGGLLAAVTGALGLLFRTLQASGAERLKFLEGQLDLCQRQTGTLQEANAGQVARFETAISGQTERAITLLREEMVLNREAMARTAAAIEEMSEIGREGRERNQRAHDRDLEQHREILVTLHALAQAWGRPLGDRADPYIREVQQEAKRLINGNEGVS
jgi:hypothetical protein